MERAAWTGTSTYRDRFRSRIPSCWPVLVLTVRCPDPIDKLYHTPLLVFHVRYPV